MNNSRCAHFPVDFPTLALYNSYVKQKHYILDLKSILDMREMTMYELAQRSGLYYNTIYRIVNNNPTSISLPVLNRLCNALNCMPGELFREVEKKKG